MPMQYKKTTLPNGLRIITIPTKGNPAATVMVMAEVGSNYETENESGLSHFIEHMCFKGTPKRPSAMHINRELDGLGARSNAMTSEELTVYFAKAEKKNWKKLLDILSDMYLHPTVPEAELEKERGVIIQEISMYEDQPQSKVGLLLPKLLYGNVPAGRWVAGTKESVQNMKRQSFFDYTKKHYVAKGTVVVVAGDIKESEVKKEVEKLFKDISTAKKHTKSPVKESQKSPQILIETKKTDQTHMLVGVRGFGAKDKRMATMDVLAAILGVGMSSRLFHKLREELGACYYVSAGADEYTDHGYFAISTGIESARTQEVLKVILAECKRLTKEEVGEVELKKTKDYIVGNIYLGLETTDALAFFYASQEISKKKMEFPSQVEKEIRAVTSKQVMKLAQELFQNKNLNLAIVGDVKNSDSLKKTLSF